jgi:hypothetical protein
MPSVRIAKRRIRYRAIRATSSNCLFGSSCGYGGNDHGIRRIRFGVWREREISCARVDISKDVGWRRWSTVNDMMEGGSGEGNCDGSFFHDVTSCRSKKSRETESTPPERATAVKVCE